MNLKNLILPFLLVFYSLGAFAESQMLSLDRDYIKESQTSKWVYDLTFNQAPPVSVYQYHPGLSDLFSKEGASMLCFPTALATSLIKQIAYQENPLKLETLPGLSADKKKIDANELVRDLFKRCRTDAEEGTDFVNGADCIYDFYRDSGFVKPNIELMIKVRLQTENTEIKRIYKRVEINDIIKSLNAGFEVIGYVEFEIPNQAEARWDRDAGHFINIFGYAKQIPWQDMTILFVSNPLRNYPTDNEIRTYDSIFAQTIKSTQQMKIDYETGNIVFEGTQMQGNISRSFLTGILSFKAN